MVSLFETIRVAFCWNVGVCEVIEHMRSKIGMGM